MNKIVKTLVLCLLGVGLAYPQAISDTNGTPVNVSRGPADKDYTDLYFYTGTYVEYVCTAPSTQVTALWKVSSVTLTNIVVTSNVAVATFPSNHGLQINNPVTVAGGGIAPFNNITYKLSAVTATTATFSVTVADGTYTTSTLQITSNAPRTTDAIFKIVKFTYDGSNLLISKQQSDWRKICDNRAATGITAITYK